MTSQKIRESSFIQISLSPCSDLELSDLSSLDLKIQSKLIKARECQRQQQLPSLIFRTLRSLIVGKSRLLSLRIHRVWKRLLVAAWTVPSMWATLEVHLIILLVIRVQRLWFILLCVFVIFSSDGRPTSNIVQS